MKLTLRYMTPYDIPQVVHIDRLSFELAWSERSYAYEVTDSEYSYLVVLAAEPAPPSANGWRRWLPRLNGGRPAASIIGYGGLWTINDEAHISTLAVHPRWRGRGFGEVLLAAMVRRSITLGAAYVALEVRVSNQRAQNLYAKYEFHTRLVKPRYYRNNDEDAFEMHLGLTDPAALGRFEARYAANRAQHGFSDHYSATERPRKQGKEA